MSKDAVKVVDYCPFCGKKGSLQEVGALVECTNDKCETKPFLIKGGVKELDRERG